MNKTPLVSVLIPTYNDAKYLPSIFDDICGQTYDNVEYIFINDCSTDNTELVIKNLILNSSSNIKYFKKEKNGGTGSALNFGIKLCSGDFITWWSSDDRKSYDFIESMLAPFISDNCADYVIGGFLAQGVRKRPYIKSNGEFVVNPGLCVYEGDTNDIYITDQKMEFLLHHRQNCINGICFMFSRYVLELFGNFLEKPEEDYHMSAKMIVLARKIAFLNKTVGEHFLRNDSLTVTGWSNRFNELGNCKNETFNIIDNYLKDNK